MVENLILESYPMHEAAKDGEKIKEQQAQLLANY